MSVNHDESSSATPSSASTDVATLLQLRQVSKYFGGVRALHEVDLDLHHAEVVALVGDNGAGKSTLVKILAGFQQPDAGRLLVNGDPVALRSVAHARSLVRSGPRKRLRAADACARGPHRGSPPASRAPGPGGLFPRRTCGGGLQRPA